MPGYRVNPAVKFLPSSSDHGDGAIDEADLHDVLSLRGDLGVLQQDGAQMQTQMSKLQEEVQVIGAKQGQISATVGTVEQVVLDLSKQLSAISSVLATLVKQPQPNNQ